MLQAKGGKAPARAVPPLGAISPRVARVNEATQAGPRLRWRLPPARSRGRDGNGASPRAAAAVTTRSAATAKAVEGIMSLLLLLQTLGRGGTDRRVGPPLPLATLFLEKSRGSGDAAAAAATGAGKTHGRGVAPDTRIRPHILPRGRQWRTIGAREGEPTAGRTGGPAWIGIGTGRSGGTTAGATPGAAALLRRRHGAAALRLALDPGPAPALRVFVLVLVLGPVRVVGGRDRRPPDGVTTAGTGLGKTGVERTAETGRGETAAGAGAVGEERERKGAAGTAGTAAEAGTGGGAAPGSGTAAAGPARAAGPLVLRSSRRRAAAARGRTAGTAGEVRPWATAEEEEEDAGTAGSVGRRSATKVVVETAGAGGSGAGAGTAVTAMMAAVARPGEEERVAG